ncbi:MAG: tetratricopeptide repeat protein [Desulfobacterales bacterium]|nr:tetratricopeptide repeat protein [Desulfobacterales bacterium]
MTTYSISCENAIAITIDLLNKGMTDKAESIFNQIIMDLPEDAHLLHILGGIAYKLEKMELSINLLNHAIQKNPLDTNLYNYLAALLKLLGRIDEALKLYEHAISINPNLPEVHNNIGLIFKLKKDVNKSIEYYKRAISINPNYAEAHYNLGITLNDIGEIDEAIKAFQSVVSINPKFDSIYIKLGNAYETKNEWELAIKYYQKAIDDNPNIPETYNSLGLAYKNKDMLKEAENAFKKAISFNPNYFEAHNNLGNIFVLQRRLDESISCYNQVIQIKPDYVTAYCNLAISLKDMGDKDRAISTFKKVIELEPQNFYAQHMLNALSGNQSEGAPKEYVKLMFDGYSKKFEEHLSEFLEYQVPTLLREIIEPFINKECHKKTSSFQNIIDLGCGTGLAGLSFRDLAAHLTGVDVSDKMIGEAKKKNIYDDFHISEIVDFLRSTDLKYDVFIASDVLVYLGNLKYLFDAVYKSAADNALFIFSIELSQKDDYALNPTGRYAHSKTYIEFLANKYKFYIREAKDAKLRKEKKQWVAGCIFVLQKI